MGRPRLNIFQQNCGFLLGTRERLSSLYPNLTFTAAVRKIVENHLNQMEAQNGAGKSYTAAVDNLLDEQLPAPAEPQGAAE